MPTKTRVLTAIVIVTAWQSAQALPLDPAACETVRVEKSELDAAGVGVDVQRGPDWGKSNLDEAGFKKVARWIELEEQLKFRCPQPKPVPDPAGSTAAKAPGAPGADDGAGAKSIDPEAGTSGDVKPSKKDRKAARKKRKSDPSAEATGTVPGAAIEETAANADPAPVKPKKSKKPKLEDAYTPPKPGDGEVQHQVPGGSGDLPAGSQGLSP